MSARLEAERLLAPSFLALAEERLADALRLTASVLSSTERAWQACDAATDPMGTLYVCTLWHECTQGAQVVAKQVANALGTPADEHVSAAVEILNRFASHQRLSRDL